ncbi:MAG: hypothetical protein ABI286_11550 [Edaphobacter sp.]
MSTHGGEQRPGAAGQVWLRRLVAPFSIIATILYVGIYAGEAYEYFHADKKATSETRESGDFRSAMQAKVKRQQDELKNVDSSILIRVYTETLENTNCTWLFQCAPVPRPRFTDWREAAARMSTTPTKADSQLLYHPGWILYIPTARTIKGTPHALREAMKQIWDTGGWAIAMFLSCTVIWAAIVWLTAAKGESALMVYCMVLGALPAISIMVSVVQLASEQLLKAGSWLAVVPIVAVHSGALTLLVGLPHIFKAPREVGEAAEVFRKIG